MGNSMIHAIREVVHPVKAAQEKNVSYDDILRMKMPDDASLSRYADDIPTVIFVRDMKSLD